jgi:hypothetical protein
MRMQHALVSPSGFCRRRQTSQSEGRTKLSPNGAGHTSLTLISQMFDFWDRPASEDQAKTKQPPWFDPKRALWLLCVLRIVGRFSLAAAGPA